MPRPEQQREVLRAQAEMILNSAAAVPEERDRRDVRRVYDAIDDPQSRMCLDEISV